MAKKYYTFDRPIKQIPAPDLCQALEGVKISELMRTIILNEKQFISVDYDRSLRNFWYMTVKPTLDKLGLLTEEDQTEEALTRWDMELSRYMAELVRLGEMTYSDLRIVDNSRRRSNPFKKYHVENLAIYGQQVTENPYPNIIICTEKDTVYNLIEDIASFFGCSCISAKGQNSFAAMEDLLRGMGDKVSSIYILALTDYDPAGYYIADAFKKQAEALQVALNITADVEIERIGIKPGQLTTSEIEENKYTPKKSNRDKWFQITGGINGEPKGLELDALTPDRIRQLFVTCIKKYIDPAAYQANDFIRKAYLRGLLLESIKPKIESMAEEITARELNSISLKEFDLFELAAEGFSSFPIDQLCYTSRQEAIKEQALSYFK
jgi:hypothetical protein